MKFKKVYLVFLIWVVVALTAACVGNLNPEEQGQLNNQISTEVVGEIRKTYPLPEPAFIINHVGDTVNFRTSLTVEEVVTFYRSAFEPLGLTERTDATAVENDSAEIVFEDPSGGKSVHIQITQSDSDTRVKLEKK